MKGSIASWMGAAADVLLPRVCTVCGERLLRSERHICLKCLADMPLTRFWTMEHNRMADRFNSVIQRELETEGGLETEGVHQTEGGLETERNHQTGSGLQTAGGIQPQGGKRERYAYAAALFIYKEGSGYTNIPQQLKYHGNIAAGRHFSRMLGRKLASSELFQDVDLVIPVPLHWMRRWKRGYNQAEVIAAEVAAELGAAMDSRILSRNRRTRTQTRLGVEEKTANVAGAFCVRSEYRGKGAMEGQSGEERKAIRHILLTDDVFTTGSTLAACFHALREAFPPSVRISVATLAFVG